MLLPDGTRLTYSDLPLLFSILLHLFLCPFSKVEESFNMQAGHDLLHLNFLSEIEAFDHLSFPGVVPRTFIGSILLTMISYPLQWANETLLVHSPLLSGMISPLMPVYIYRGTLGVLVWMSCCAFRTSLQNSQKFTPRTSILFNILLAVQFHIPFYASRSLPNTFALAVVMYSYSYWFQNEPTKCLYCIGIAAVLFRCDMLVLLVPMALLFLLCEGIPFQSTLAKGIVICCVTVILSVLVDSYFWQRLLWPEGEVLFFNTVENRSSEWGTFPFHWYFSSAIPKALHCCLPLTLLGLVIPSSSKRSDRSLLWYYLCPSLCFLVLYSYLPHKELRFIFPAIPLLTLAAARGLDSLLPEILLSKVPSSASVRARQAMSMLFLLGFVTASLVVTSVFTAAAYVNYPGGQALMLLNQHLLAHSSASSCTFAQALSRKGAACHDESTASSAIHVHIDASAAMSGITRFGQLHLPGVVYSKNESKHIDFESFDWLLTGDPNNERIGDNFRVWHTVQGFGGFRVKRNYLSKLRDSAKLSYFGQEFSNTVEQHPTVPSKIYRLLCRVVSDINPLEMVLKNEIYIIKKMTDNIRV